MPRKLVVSRRLKVYVVKYKKLKPEAHSIRDSTEFFFKEYSDNYIKKSLQDTCERDGYMLLSYEKPVEKYCRCDMDIDYYFQYSRKHFEEKE
ncbi:MAG: hypothetical protein J6V44_09610 [Methanobrevibacter sp.]|nr:hypothetical protein [Methanobrevibacter sp.]